MSDNVKKIGIVAGPISKSAKTGVNTAYVDYFNHFGDVELIYTNNETVRKDLDLLVLPGGEDLDPATYGEKPNVNCMKPNIFYERFDKDMLPKYIDAKIPIVGICRGFQRLGVYFGNKLEQHIVQEYSTTRSELAHSIKFMTNTAKKYGTSTFRVNSLHHQGFYFDKFNDNNLEVLAININNGKSRTPCQITNIEAFRHRRLPIFGVQWHPEEIWDDFTTNCIHSLINAKVIV